MSEKTTHIYESAPIDHWKGFQEWTEYISRLLVTDSEPEFDTDLCNDESNVLLLQSEIEALRRAVRLVREQTLWEGDGRWMVAGTPGDNACELIYAVKQSNNGATFLVSPIPLPNLSLVGKQIAIPAEEYPCAAEIAATMTEGAKPRPSNPLAMEKQ